MMMWRYFRKKYLHLQICWHISDKGQSFTFFLLLCEDRYAPPWTRDLWEKVHSHLIYSHSLKTHISVIGPSKLPLGVWRPMTLIKMGWLENGGMNSPRSAVLLDLRMSETGCAVIPVPSRHVPPAWIIHTLLNSDQCSKISAKMHFSVSDLFCFALPALEATYGWGWWNS